MEKKLKFGTHVLAVALLTLITSLTWIAFEVYQSSHKSTITQATQEEMKSLNPNMNKEVLEALKKDISFKEEDLNLVISQPTTQSGILKESQ